MMMMMLLVQHSPWLVALVVCFFVLTTNNACIEINRFRLNKFVLETQLPIFGVNTSKQLTSQGLLRMN